ncbi:MAG TPA: hypothetical protein VKY74_14325 [Chloroflexia bacterium]|nr:hypothetical protein [Chloroflexia bacterium]
MKRHQRHRHIQTGYSTSLQDPVDPSDPDSLAATQAAAVDNALRYVLRGGVAGASPSPEAWLRLQQRIAQPVPAEQAAPTRRAPAGQRPRPWQRGTLVPLLRPHLSQVSMAMLLLAMLGAVLPAAPWAQLGATPLAVPNTGAEIAAHPPARVNRALQILGDAGDGPEATLAAEPPAADPPAVTMYTGRGPDGLVVAHLNAGDPALEQRPGLARPDGETGAPNKPGLPAHMTPW